MIRVIFFIFLSSFGVFINASTTHDFTAHNPYSQSTVGGIGLIQTPTARFSDDGEFGFGMSHEKPYNRYFSRVQFFPWMEAVLKYTEGTHRAYGPGADQTWKDKGFDIKLKILDEKSKGINLAIGLQDIGGTGYFSSEYLVASKRYGSFDWSLGLGWGRLGGVDHVNNFIGWFDEDRRIRGANDYFGGTLNLDNYFSGEHTSIFGGFEYFSPIENLSLKVEYDTSDYSFVEGKERVFNEIGDIFELDSRVNYAINYRLGMSDRDKLDLALGFVRGNTVYANFTIHSNLNSSGDPKVIIGPEKIRNSNLPEDSFKDLDNYWQNFLTNRIIREMANNGFVTHKVIYKENELIAEISQARFQETVKFLDLASKILSNNALQNIENITVVNIDQGIETMRSTIERDSVRKASLKGPLPEELFTFNEFSYSVVDQEIRKNDFLYPNFYWEIKPHLNNTIQHQERFFFWQLEALVHTEYSIDKGLYLITDIGINIDNNFDDYTYHIPDGQLYHVRQDRRLYLTEGKTGLRRMQIDHLIDFNQNLKAKVSAGLLEWMYGGIGGELLYMHDSRKWGIGIDAYWVKQRDYDQKFSFKDYETVTSFVSFYRDIPFYNMRLKLSAGKFLAKDVGTMIDISRRFENGARVGGFAVLSDCDSSCVGEGSFHKGVYFELPMDLFYLQSTTRNKTGYSWSPLTKDAGAKLDAGGLYQLMTSASDEVDLLRQKNWSAKKILSGFGIKPKSRKISNE